jgi:adenosylhomocysteinase
MGKKTMIVPKEIDRQIAVDALKAMNVKIDRLTAEQKKYAESW